MEYKFKKRLTSTLLIMCCILLTFKTEAQQPKVPIVNPVSPTTASLFKVLERPLGTYTGTVPISFPLYTVQSGSLLAPVTLDYNSTGGIRVEEMASNVGLGFSMNVGGRISRIQNGGVSDDQPGYGRLNNSVKPSNFSSTNYSHLAGLHAKQIDLEADLFMYSFNGQAGKFYLKENGQVMMMQETNIKIQFTTDSQGIATWTITDGEGAKYYFTLKETTISTIQPLYGGPTPLPNYYVSGWVLTEIKDMNDENSITFSYQAGGTTFNTYSGGTTKRQSKFVYYCDPFSADDVMVETNVNEYVLTKITGRSGYVNFNSTFDRSDVQGGSKLRSIAIYDYNANLKKTYKFNYDYFIAQWGGSYPDDRRLKLKNFSSFGSTGTDSLTHKFDYEENVSQPNRLSRAVDFWGFYNGELSNWTYLPNTFSNYYGVPDKITNFSNRHANPAFAKASILTKITYPTGGSREFVYEGNTALLKLDDQLTMDPDYTVRQGFSRTDITNPGIYIPSLKQEFTVNSNDGWTTFKYNISTSGYCGAAYRVEIYRLSYPGEFGGTLWYTFSNQQSADYQLANGYYRLEIYKESYCTFSSIAAGWDESTLGNIGISTPYDIVARYNREVGGLRIREIKDYDPVTAKSNSVHYRYKLYSTDSTLTSGFLNTPVRIMNEFNNDCYSTCQYMMLYSTSCYPLANDGGSYVVYPEVRTIESGNGYTDRRFTYQPDILPPVTTYPLQPIPTENSKVRGKLLLEKVYNQAGAPVRETASTYGYIKWDSQGVLGYKVRLYYNRSGWPLSLCWESGDGSFPYPAASRALPYRHWGRIIGLWNTSETIYGPSGNQTITKTFAYDTTGTDKPILKQVKTTVNNSKTKEVNYKYAFNPVGDFSFGLTAGEQTMKTTLLGLNYLQPLEITNTITPSGGSPTLLSGLKFSFGTWYTNKYHLSNLKEYTSPTIFRETFFTDYDDRGNLREKYRDALQREVYLWGYNRLYLVAKITGSNHSVISPWYTQSTLDNPANDASLRLHLGTVRTNLASSPLGARVEIYTYDPLTGITSSTDAKGAVTYYEYDNRQQLKTIKDNNGKVVKTHDYHYKP